MGSKGVVWRPIATIAAAVGDVELEDQVLRLSRYLGYAKVLLNNFYFLGGGPALNLNLVVQLCERTGRLRCTARK